jgi:membrane protein DedA with SNARE-associated domain
MSQVDITVIYLIVISFAFIENIFPPSPSDVIVIIGASLIANQGAANFISMLILTSLASSAGFMLMYWVGKKFGQKILRSHRLKFISEENLETTNKWFMKYGYALILANRFLPGTRSAISFFTGIHELSFGKTFLFATISAFLWNVFIIWLGFALGQNVEIIDHYLKTYSSTVILITLLLIVFWILKKIVKKRKTLGL